MKYFQAIIWAVFFVGGIWMFWRFGRRLKLDGYRRAVVQAVLKKQQKNRGKSYFSSQILTQALLAVLYKKGKKEKRICQDLLEGSLESAETYMRERGKVTTAVGLKAFYNPEGAISDLEALVQNRPADAEAPVMLATLYFNRGSFTAAEALLDNINEKKTAAYAKAQKCYLQAFFDMRDGDLQSASINSSQAAKLFNKTQAFYEEAATHFVMGTVYRISTAEDTAQFMLRTAGKIFNALGAEKEEGEVSGTLGMLMVAQQRFDEAEDYFNQALEIYKRIGQEQGQGEVINQQALALLIRKDFKAALKLAKQAQKIHQQVGNDAGVALSLEIIGNIYKEQQEWQKVIRPARQAQELYKHSGNIPALLETYLLEAGALYESGNDRGSEKILRKIIAADREQRSCFHVANAYNRLGLIFLRQGDLQRAKGFFQQSLDCEMRNNRTGGIAVDYANIALIEYRRGLKEQADKTVETALEFAKASGENQLYELLAARFNKKQAQR